MGHDEVEFAGLPPSIERTGVGENGAVGSQIRVLQWQRRIGYQATFGVAVAHDQKIDADGRIRVGAWFDLLRSCAYHAGRDQGEQCRSPRYRTSCEADARRVIAGAGRQFGLLLPAVESTVLAATRPGGVFCQG